MQPELNRMATQPLPSNFNSTLQGQSGVVSSSSKQQKQASVASIEKGTKNSYYLKQQLQQNRAK